MNSWFHKHWIHLTLHAPRIRKNILRSKHRILTIDYIGNSCLMVILALFVSLKNFVCAWFPRTYTKSVNSPPGTVTSLARKTCPTVQPKCTWDRLRARNVNQWVELLLFKVVGLKSIYLSAEIPDNTRLGSYFRLFGSEILAVFGVSGVRQC